MAVTVAALSSVLTPTFLLIFLTTFLLAVVIHHNWRSSQFPPGPISFPIIGSLLSLAGGDIREKFLQLSKRHGELFTLDMGMTRMVILASYDVIKEALVKNADIMAGRPLDMFVFKDAAEGKGIAGTHGPFWREQRKFIHSVFREFGVGRPVFEEKIQEEISYFLQVLREKTGQPYDIKELLQSAVSNVINNVIYGRRYPYGDAQFLKHIKLTQEGVNIVGNGGPLTLWPFLKYLPGDLFNFKRLKINSDIFQGDISKSVNEHKETRTPGVIRDVIDAYLEEMARQKDNPDTTFTEDQLGFMIGEMFTAGTETTANTLRWAMVYLLHHPEVYQHLQREVDEVVGPSRMPTMADKQSMPYTEAVICEVQRMADIVPLGVPHACHSDVTLRGYSLPAGTVVLPILHAAHRDPKVWPEPNRFKPERFLDKDGTLCKNEHLIPFSMGRRVCLGESLARMELFLFFVALMQHFRFRLPTGSPLPELIGDLGLTYLARPFEIVLEQK